MNRTKRTLAVLCVSGLVSLGTTATVQAGDSPEVNLPPPTEWDAPPGAPTAPGDAFAVTFTSATVAQSPVIAEGNETALPDESFTLAGARFTLRGGDRAGSDCAVWLWVDTPAGGELHSCQVWHVEDSLLTATVPAGLPYRMYLVWVENQAGASAPVCLNRPRLSWIGPIDARAAPGSAKRVFGFNLAHDHGKTLSHVYCRSADGGAMTALPVTAVEPYAVTFTAPTQPGSYKICVHAGHGGRFGWSAPLDLTVATPWTRGTNSVTVQPSGSNDLTAIQNAIDAMAGQAQGGTVRLVTGTYRLRPSNTRGLLQLKAGVCLCGGGKEATVLRLEWPGGSEETALLLLENSQVEALTIRIGSISGNGRIVRCTSGQGRLVNLRVEGDAGLTDGSPCLLFEKGEITGCDLYRWIFTAGADGLWIHHNNLYGTLHGLDGAIGTIFSNTRMVVESNHFATPAWPVGPGGRRDYLNFMPPAEYRKLNFCTRFYWGCGSRQYWAHNTSKDTGPGHSDYNKGETILFHVGTSGLYAHVADAQDDTLTIRTDGLIDGRPAMVDENFRPMTRIPNSHSSVVVVRGPGRGQKRNIRSRTATTITVDRPWRVPPQAGSVIAIVRTDEDNIVFENEINALPPGYVPYWSASVGPDFDGNCWKSVATIVYNYWDDRPAVQTYNDRVKWIVLARPQEKTLLVVLQSWATNDLTVKLDWDTQALGFVPGTQVLNAENSTTLPASDGPLNLVLPGPYGTRLIKMR